MPAHGPGEVLEGSSLLLAAGSHTHSVTSSRWHQSQWLCPRMAETKPSLAGKGVSSHSPSLPLHRTTSVSSLYPNQPQWLLIVLRYCLGWKRPLSPSSPAINALLPRPLLNHVLAKRQKSSLWSCSKWGKQSLLEPLWPRAECLDAVLNSAACFPTATLFKGNCPYFYSALQRTLF